MLSSSRSRCSNSNSRGYVRTLNQPEQTSAYLQIPNQPEAQPEQTGYNTII